MRQTLSFRTGALTLALSASLLAGCSTTSPDVVSRDHAQRMQTLQRATIESIRPVIVDGTQSGMGGAAGAIVGGIAGSSVGGQREAVAVGVLAGVAGAVIGNAIERASTREAAEEIIVRLDNGERRSLVQARGQAQLRAGDRVELVSNGGKYRVIPAR